MYSVIIPADAAKTWQGESCSQISWQFITGFYATAVSMGGPELGAALMTDRSLWTWGRRLTEANAEDGSYSYDAVSVPAAFSSGDVAAVSSGFMHHALLRRDGSLWMWGRQLCGEFGNGSTTASAQPVKVMDGVRQVSCGLQTTAIIKQDGTLWMCGRNDLGQIDDTRTVHHNYIKVADGVSAVTLHWGSLDIAKSDGSTETRTWDTDIDSQRVPSPAVIDDMSDVAYGWDSAIALKNDGSVWAWGANSTLNEVISGRNAQTLEGIRLLSETVTVPVGGRAILSQRPLPLLADYSSMEWSSDNEAIATVDHRGMVTGVKDGTTLVTVTIADAYGRSFEATCQVAVGSVSGINSVVNDDDWLLKVAAESGHLLISGVPEGRQVSVYNSSGICLWQGRMQSRKMKVDANHSGICIVRAGRQVRKIAVK